MNNKSLLIALLLSLFLNSLGLASNTFHSESKEEHPPKLVLDDFTTYSKDLYAALNEPDLNYKAFETALKGFVKLQLEDNIDNTKNLTVIYMSLSANDHRYILINLTEKKE